MSFPRYARYSETEVPWLKTLPVSWRVMKFRHLFRESSEKIVREVVGPMLSVSGYRGVEVKVYDDENRKRTEEDLLGYRIVRVGQLVVNTMWLNYAGLGVSEFEGHVSPAYRSYFIDETLLNRRFAHRLMRSSLYVAAYTQLLTGIRPNSLQMSREDLMSFPIIVPPLEDQVAIADFLDTESTCYDALIAEQQRLIELLKEKRQAVISHAVTKGLNPDAPMKQSGIEWIGEVPAHWQLQRLGRISIARCDGPFGSGLKSEHYTESGVRVIRLQNIKSGSFDDRDKAYVDVEYHDRELSGHEVIERDVLIAGLGDDNNRVGRACVAPSGVEPAMVKADCFRFRLDRAKAHPEFVANALCVGAEFDSGVLSTGSTRSRIPLSTMSGRVVPLPPLIEQELIARSITNASAEFDRLIAEAERTIELLQERRTALISAAVTGQIDVRGLANRSAA